MAESTSYIGLHAASMAINTRMARSPPPLPSTTNNPSIIVREKGYRSIYFTGQLGRLYWRTGLPDKSIVRRDTSLRAIHEERATSASLVE
ncbi:MAG: hypothetical protein ACP5PL_07400 [Infirmifilum sp.]